jgi:hypothetical protein
VWLGQNAPVFATAADRGVEDSAPATRSEAIGLTYATIPATVREAAMSHRLFVVDGTFTVFGRGIGLLPGVPKDELGPRVTPGMTIELHRPDGTVLATTIRAVEWFQTPPAPSAPLHMPPEIRKEDVPVGTEVWLDDDPPSPEQ